MDALELRAILDQRRRRERELAALFETAWDLTRFRNVEPALRAIVRRAQTLLQSDTAYLTLLDKERDEVAMRVSAGTISPEFASIRLPIGKGIGGLVAKNGAPYQTPNYLNDPRYEHTQDVDGVVQAEGLIAILGVPLKLGEQVIGVLFASDRSERRFTASDVSLLSSFAAMAAIAIENARLSQESSEALRELAAANEVISARSKDVERAAEAHATMTALVAQGTDLPNLVNSLRRVLGGSLMVVNTTGLLLAQAGKELDELETAVVAQGMLPKREIAAPLFQAVAESGDTGRALHVELAPPLFDRWVAPVFGAGEQLGALVLTSKRELSDVEIRTLERASHVTALLMLNRRSMMESRRRASQELVECIVDSSVLDKNSLDSQAQAAGLGSKPLGTGYPIEIWMFQRCSSNSSIVYITDPRCDTESS